MLSGPLTVALRRGFYQSAIRRGHAKPTAQDMLPFNPFQNKWILLAKISLFFGVAFNAPFFLVRTGLKKKYGNQQ